MIYTQKEYELFGPHWCNKNYLKACIIESDRNGLLPIEIIHLIIP